MIKKITLEENGNSGLDIQNVQDKLMRVGVKTKIKPFLDRSTTYEDLIKGETDIFIGSLNEYPTEPIDGLSLAALSKRKSNTWQLLIPDSLYDLEQDFRIQSDAELVSVSDLLLQQMKVYRPDIRLELTNRVSMEEQLIDLDKVFIVESEFCPSQDQQDVYKNVNVNPKELIAKAGTGVDAFVCRTEDLPLRKNLAAIHHAEVATCTNVERIVEKAFNNEMIGVYCFMDRLNNYHAHAVLIKDGVKKVRLSYSTTQNLAKDIIEKLQN